MNSLSRFKTIITIVTIILSLFGVVLFVCIATQHSILLQYLIDAEINENAGYYGDFVGGVIGTIFSVVSVLLIILTIIYQNTTNCRNATIDQFFKMLDCHYSNINMLEIKTISRKKEHEGKIKNRRAFVVFKIQLSKILEIIKEINKKNNLCLSELEIADISYVIFYYGLDAEWKEFSKDKLEKYRCSNLIIKEFLKKQHELRKQYTIGRTNQTSLSAYFRNLYNTIKLIDNSNLSHKEKKQYITILRAQLSNPELYILYFNILSRFGRKWRDSGYITRYEFIKNLPRKYCSGYDPARDFPMTYEEDELS